MFYPGYFPRYAQGKPDFATQKKVMGGMIDEEEEETSEEEEDEDNAHAPTFEGGYNPADFENLAVSADIKELFQYIGRYTPQQVCGVSL